MKRISALVKKHKKDDRKKNKMLKVFLGSLRSNVGWLVQREREREREREMGKCRIKIMKNREKIKKDTRERTNQGEK